MKTIILNIAIIILSSTLNASYSQCNPITIPKASESTYGGVFCLEGTKLTSSSEMFENLCLGNVDGIFELTKNTQSGDFIKRIFTASDTQLSLKALNAFNNQATGTFYDFSFDFSDAGSAFIRAVRGSGNDTQLQFLTNPIYGNSNVQSSSPPPIRMIINSEGNVGINTPQTGPNYRLDVYGVAKFTDEGLDDGKLVIKGSNTTNYIPTGNLFNASVKRDISFEFTGAGSSIIRSFRGGNMDTYLQFLTNSKSSSTDVPQVRMQINDDGKIIIGNVPVPTSSSYKLYVEDGILTEKVKVAVKTSNEWSDHVFDPTYKLRTLYEVEEYINEHKHLPAIPSSNELINNGLNLGEMQAKQMEKIEELTLYMIDLKKEIDELKKINEILKEEILSLKKN